MSIAKPGSFFNVVWGFHLEPMDAGTTRFIERWRVDWSSSLENELYMRAFLEPGAFIMGRDVVGLSAASRKHAPRRSRKRVNLRGY